MGIPNRFTDVERAELDTTSIVEMPEGVIVSFGEQTFNEMFIGYFNYAEVP